MSTIADDLCAIMSTPMDKTFSEWLLAQINKTGLSQAEFSRRVGISRQAVSNYVNQQRSKPDEDTLHKIAQYLHLSPEEVFRAAGLLPQNPKINQVDEHANHLIQTLKNPTSKQRAIDYLQLLIEQEEREERENAAKKNHPATQPR